MADTSNLTQFLTDVAGAIKEKTGKTDKIPAANFDTEIKAIEAGGVKLFETVEKMQADTTAKEGDKAVVYRSDIKSVSNGDTITSITFPKTVVFTEAITSDYYGRLRNSSEPRIYLDIQLDASRFMLYDMNGTIRGIGYSSTDGITYTRTDSNEDTYEIGETTVEDLDEHICKFMQTGGNVFEGLYEYDIKTSKYAFTIDGNTFFLPEDFVSKYSDSSYDDGLGARPFYDYGGAVIEILEYDEHNIITNFNWYQSGGGDQLRQLQKDGKMYFAADTYGGLSIRHYNNGTMTCDNYGSNSSDNHLDWNPSPGYELLCNSGSGKFRAIKEITSNTKLGLFETHANSYWNDIKYVYSVDNNAASITTTPSYISNTHDIAAYNIAKTQLTLKNVNELLPGKIAYGKNGIVTGDGSIYENLDNYKVLSAFFDLNDIPDYAKAKTSTEVSIDKYVPYGLSRVPDLTNGYNTLHYVKSPINNNVVNYDGIPRPRSNREYFQKIGTKLYSLRSPNASTAPYLGYSLITLNLGTNTTQVEQIVSQGDTSYSCDWAILNDALYFIHVKTSSDDGITKTIEFSKYDLVSKEIKIIEVISVTATAQNTSCRPFISIYNNEIYYGYTNSLSTTSYKKETSYTIKKYEKDTITTVFTSKNYNSDATNCGVTSDGKYFALTYAGGASQSNAVFSFAEHIEKTFQHKLPINSVYATSGIYEYDDKLYFAATQQTSDTKSRVLFDFKNNLYSLVDLTDIDTSKSLLYKFGDSTFIRTNESVNGCYIYYQLHNGNSLVATESFKTPSSLILSVDENSIIDCLTDIYQIERINNSWLCHALSTGKTPTLTYNLSPCIHYKENVIKDELLKPASSDILVYKDNGLSTILLNITSPQGYINVPAEGEGGLE